MADSARRVDEIIVEWSASKPTVTRSAQLALQFDACALPLERSAAGDIFALAITGLARPVDSLEAIAAAWEEYTALDRQLSRRDRVPAHARTLHQMRDYRRSVGRRPALRY